MILSIVHRDAAKGAALHGDAGLDAASNEPRFSEPLMRCAWWFAGKTGKRFNGERSQACDFDALLEGVSGPRFGRLGGSRTPGVNAASASGPRSHGAGMRCQGKPY